MSTCNIWHCRDCYEVIFMEKFSSNSKERDVLNSIVGTFYRGKNDTCASVFRKETIEEAVGVFGINKTAEILHSISTYHPCVDYLKLQIKNQLLHGKIKDAYEKVINYG